MKTPNSVFQKIRILLKTNTKKGFLEILANWKVWTWKVWACTALMKEENRYVYNCDDKRLSGSNKHGILRQINAGVCEIFKVCCIYSFKCVQVLHTDLSVWRHFHTPKHDAERNELWLVLWHVDQTASWAGLVTDLSVLHHSQRTPAPDFTWALIKHTCTSSDPHHHTLLKHTPHLSQGSDLAYTKWTHTYVCLSSSVTPARLRCRPEVRAYHVIHEFLARKPSSLYPLTFYVLQDTDSPFFPAHPTAEFK